jgi:hypothetical protein
VVYEGQAAGMTASESFYEYFLNGYRGELKSYKYSNKGSLGSEGAGSYNYQTFVEYTQNAAKHIFGLPVKVQVKDANGTLYRQTEAEYNINFANHITKITQTLNAQNDKAISDIEYDALGNITKKTFPANYKGERMFFKYTYDRDYNMYPERIEDALGYRSEMEDYDYRYGIPLTISDMNGYTQETTIDNLGRITKILAPNEQVIGAPYTIQFEYHPQVTKETDGSLKAPAYAVTKHYDPQYPTDDLETVTFTDGFGRAVQVKKDGVVYEGGTDKKVMLVSGRDYFGETEPPFRQIEPYVKMANLGYKYKQII